MISHKGLLLVTLTFSCVFNNAFAQQYPTNYFRSPLDIPLFAAGTFGELRPNHFHSGLDIKTNNVEGLNVYAVADGYISRIRVQANGFGKAIYISHPNGYTSVYGHLSKYNAEIGAYVKQIQYQREEFEVDLQLKLGEITVKKGDIIALSGNTGNSGGPHLHFELRETKTEAIINPLLFGFSLIDKQAPILQSIMLCPIGAESHVNRNNNELKLKLKGENGTYTLASNLPIKVYGKIGFAIQTYDTQDANMNENGIYSIDLLIDGKPFYSFVMEKFKFDETRYINAHVDFEEQQKSKAFFQRCFILPNNKFECYKLAINRGVGNFYDTKPHIIHLMVKDASGNTSIVSFQIQGDGNPLPIIPTENCTVIFPYENVNAYKTADFRIVIPKNTLFDSLCFHYSVSLPGKGCYSKLHHVQTSSTPVLSSFSISIMPINLPEKLRSKAIIALYDDKGQALGQGGAYEDGYITAKINKFGTFGVAVDTTAPFINPLNIRPNMSIAQNLRFHIGDNLSGLKIYRCTIDEHWILAELDGKSGILTYTFDEHISKGRHHLKLVVTDAKNNSRSYQSHFTY